MAEFLPFEMFSHQNPIFYSSMSLRMPDPAASQSLLGCKGHHLNAGVGPDGKSDPIFLSRGKINSYWHCACGQKNQDTQIPPDPPSSQLGNSFIPIMLPTCITSLTILAVFQRGKVFPRCHMDPAHSQADCAWSVTPTLNFLFLHLHPTATATRKDWQDSRCGFHTTKLMSCTQLIFYI